MFTLKFSTDNDASSGDDRPPMYRCDTCDATTVNLAEARKHAKQGYKTQREAFFAGSLHSLSLIEGWTPAPRARPTG